MAASGYHARALDGTPIAYQREGAEGTEGTGRRVLLLLAGQSNNHPLATRPPIDAFLGEEQEPQ